MKIVLIFVTLATSLSLYGSYLQQSLARFDVVLNLLRKRTAVEKNLPKINYPTYQTLYETPQDEIRYGKIITAHKKKTTDDLEKLIQSKILAFKLPSASDIAQDPELAQKRNKELEEIRTLLFAYHYRPQPDPKNLKPKDPKKEAYFEQMYVQMNDKLEQMIKQKTSVDEQVVALVAEVETQKKSLQSAITSSKTIAKATPAQIKNVEKLLAAYQAIAKKFKDKYKKSIEDNAVVSEAKKVIKQLKSTQYSKQDLEAAKKIMKEADKIFKSKINQLKTTKSLSAYILDKFIEETTKYKQALDAYEKMVNEPYPAGPETLEDINKWILQKRLDLRRGIIRTPTEEEEEEDIEAAQQELAQLTQQAETLGQKPSEVIKTEKKMEDLFGKQLSQVKITVKSKEEQEEEEFQKEIAKLSPAERKKRIAEREEQKRKEKEEWE